MKVKLHPLLTSALDVDWSALLTGHCTPGERFLVARWLDVREKNQKKKKKLVTADSRTKISLLSSIIPVTPPTELSLAPCHIGIY